jgi:hypothetical protein
MARSGPKRLPINSNRKIVVACQEHIGHSEVMRHPMVWEIENRPGFWYMEFNDDFGVICNSEDPQNFEIVKYDKRPEKFDVGQCDNPFYRLEWADACARHGKR